MAKKISPKKLVKGLVFGAIVGGSAALLLAPRSGKETQKVVSKKINETVKLFTDVKNSAEDVQLNAAHLNYLADTLVPEFIDGTEKSVERFKFKSKHRIADIKKQFEKINTEIENLANELNE